MSKICCVSRRHAPCTHQILNLLTSTDGSLDKKIKALVIGSFSPLFLPMACICDLTINTVRLCKPNFFKVDPEKRLPTSIVKKIQNNTP